MQPTDKELAEARALTAAKRRASRMSLEGKEGIDRELILELVAIIESAALRTARQTFDPDQRFEDYVQSLIAKAPNARQLGERLAEWLDEDRFNNVNPQLLALARMEAATPASASEVYPDGSDREVLNYLMQQFDSESWECQRCGHSEATSDMDSAAYLRKYLLGRPAPASGEGQQGEIVVTRDDDGEMIMVSRQNADGEVLEVIASTCHAGGKATQQQAGQAVAWAWMHSNGVDVIGMTDEPINAEAWRLAGHKVAPLYTTPQTPDGYVLVPREPTEAMIEASMIAIPIAKRIPAGSTFRVYGARAWEAMIAASEASGDNNGDSR